MGTYRAIVVFCGFWAIGLCAQTKSPTKGTNESRSPAQAQETFQTCSKLEKLVIEPNYFAKTTQWYDFMKTQKNSTGEPSYVLLRQDLRFTDTSFQPLRIPALTEEFSRNLALRKLIIAHLKYMTAYEKKKAHLPSDLTLTDKYDYLQELRKHVFLVGYFADNLKKLAEKHKSWTTIFALVVKEKGDVKHSDLQKMKDWDQDQMLIAFAKELLVPFAKFDLSLNDGDPTLLDSKRENRLFEEFSDYVLKTDIFKRDLSEHWERWTLSLRAERVHSIACAPYASFLNLVVAVDDREFVRMVRGLSRIEPALAEKIHVIVPTTNKLGEKTYQAVKLSEQGVEAEHNILPTGMAFNQYFSFVTTPGLASNQETVKIVGGLSAAEIKQMPLVSSNMDLIQGVEFFPDEENRQTANVLSSSKILNAELMKKIESLGYENFSGKDVGDVTAALVEDKKVFLGQQDTVAFYFSKDLKIEDQLEPLKTLAKEIRDSGSLAVIVKPEVSDDVFSQKIYLKLLQ